jgi:hypothetical protein
MHALPGHQRKTHAAAWLVAPCMVICRWRLMRCSMAAALALANLGGREAHQSARTQKLAACCVTQPVYITVVLTCTDNQQVSVQQLTQVQLSLLSTTNKSSTGSLRLNAHCSNTCVFALHKCSDSATLQALPTSNCRCNQWHACRCMPPGKLCAHVHGVACQHASHRHVHHRQQQIHCLSTIGRKPMGTPAWQGSAAVLLLYKQP